MIVIQWSFANSDLGGLGLDEEGFGVYTRSLYDSGKAIEFAVEHGQFLIDAVNRRMREREDERKSLGY